MRSPFLQWARGPPVWPPVRPDAASIRQPAAFTSPRHSEPAAHPELPFPGILSLAPFLPPLGSPLPSKTNRRHLLLLLLPAWPPPFPPLSSAGFHWFSTRQEWPELFCLFGRAETRKGGKIIQMSSWLELLKAASSLLLLSLHTPSQRGHAPKEGEVMFGVVSTGGRAGGNGCGWPGRLS